ncbi:flagellar export chaperone FlgN [Paraglaciecola psychrophila]|jgi:flagella synthesis protein FlgN|uniref:FlgN family protein n=1 Tax=Paraglaciecola psychrophila 170 TaxID=1129794 RepID=K7AQG2_9ALTE|nr:flagellar export chaperone FlgN [Paraglaciecola psychrophila]AGH45828.1 FlgN family protein [Paraglaciecola psychrophila 170]GAC37550.1 flagella synthesis protein FlgN [Paraglaciecola psychrophila 170]
MFELKKAIKSQHEFLLELQQILETELHLISSRDAESLINMLKTKEALLDSIQKQDTLIAGLYTKSSQEQKDNQEVVELFNHAKDMVAQCKYRTQINQTAVEQGQLRLEHLRNLLLESRAKESMTYDKSGRTQGGTSGSGISA